MGHQEESELQVGNKGRDKGREVLFAAEPSMVPHGC